MNQTVIWILLAGAMIIVAVLLFNMYQENLYRKKIRAQFGHSNRDALMEDGVNQIRDGKSFRQPENIQFEEAKDNTEIHLDEPSSSENNEDAIPFSPKRPPKTTPILQVGDSAGQDTYQFSDITLPDLDRTHTQQKLLVDLNELQKTELSWFHPSIDYRAFISLPVACELPTMPRLSVDRRRITLIGNTPDGNFQKADPIPGVYYQAFVVGLQAISRAGLVSRAHLEEFNDKVNEFARQVNGTILLTDIDEFLKNARLMDDLCSRVDQVIALHLMSDNTIAGTELRSVLEKHGFTLSSNGAFYFHKDENIPLFKAVDIEDKPFTQTLLAAQSYRGVSMLFDITSVPPGAGFFNQFMDLTVRISRDLDLTLVNDKLEELSIQWLERVGDYISERQAEMKAARIIPGSELSKRLFA